MTRLLQLTLLFFVVALCAQFAVVNAQDKSKEKVASFKGKLFRSDTNKPIANARVILLDDQKSDKQNNSQETQSNAEGTFSFEHVTAGKYTVSIRVSYDNEEDIPCRLLLGKLKGEKDSQLLVISDGGKKIYQVFIKGFSVKAKKNITKEYDLVCVSAFGG
ncbi:MAG TPA: carboxypeptidase-like regulatory domain-containing protein [Pyrinomonadaceae bacterium]|nr:carboxypeptidase-like regulatory domain-containing protein [Pyrinomonadaceae bacterium]